MSSLPRRPQPTPAPRPAAQRTPVQQADVLLTELQKALDGLTAAHVELAASLRQQHDAMKAFDTTAMAEAARRQEQIHRRVMRLEQQRRQQVQNLARVAGRQGAEMTLIGLADLYPAARDGLLERRAALRQATTEAAERGRACGRLAGGVLSHLNAALRLLTDATTYGRTGGFDVAPRVSTRLARLEAVA